MATMTIEVPDDLLAHLKNGGNDASQELRLAAAFSLCARGELSTSQAARLAGLSYAAFLAAAVQRHVDLYDYDIEEIKAETARPVAGNVEVEAIKQEIAAHAARG